MVPLLAFSPKEDVLSSYHGVLIPRIRTRKPETGIAWMLLQMSTNEKIFGDCFEVEESGIVGRYIFTLLSSYHGV